MTRTAAGSYKAWVYLGGVRRTKTFRLQKEANAWAIGELLSVGGPEASTPFEGAFGWWLENRRTRLSPTTWEAYDSIARTHLYPHFGKTRMDRIEDVTLEAYYRSLELSPTTVRQHHAILNRFFKDQVKRGLLRRNPASLVVAPRRAHHEVTVLEKSQLRRLVEGGFGWVEAPAVLSATTGARRGEICALRWSDVRLRKREISIVRSAVQTKAGIVDKAPKTKSGRRIIPFGAATLRALEKQRAWQEGWCARLGCPPPEWVCTSEAQQRLRPSTLSDGFQNALRHTDLPRIRFHDLRHTHATLLLQAGVNVKVVSQRLGHSSIGITLQTYGHVMPDMQELAVEVMDAILA